MPGLAGAQLGHPDVRRPHLELIRRARIHVHTCSSTAWPLVTTGARNYSENTPFVSAAVALPLEGCQFGLQWVGELDLC